MKYFHVDVFAEKPLYGNGLTVVFLDTDIETSVLLRITQEFKQYETVFVYPEENGSFPIRVFTVQEELPFAGHPLLGTAAILHRVYYPLLEEKCITLRLQNRLVQLDSKKNGDVYSVVMNQGTAQFLGVVQKKSVAELAAYFNLSLSDISTTYPVEVVSTGLAYLLLPVETNLERAAVVKKDLESWISEYRAKFVYLFNPHTLECRTWDNSGLYEDVATGSAAGPLFSYLVKNGYCKKDERIQLVQGNYLGRESSITGWVSSVKTQDVYVEGSVAFFGNGEITV